jgi:hypothetical protein
VKATAAEVLREAAKGKRSNETFEKALGRAVRENQGTYRDYQGLIEKVRRRAKKDDSTHSDAAKALANES